MSLSEIFNIVLIIVAIIASVSWGVLYTRTKRAWGNMLKLRDEYMNAKADGVISDAEKAQIADTVVEIISDAATIWQALENFVRQLIPIISKKRL